VSTFSNDPRLTIPRRSATVESQEIAIGLPAWAAILEVLHGTHRQTVVALR